MGYYDPDSGEYIEGENWYEPEHQGRQIDPYSGWEPEEYEPEPEPSGPSIAWPSAVAPNASAWVTDNLSPSGYGYRVHSGVTLSGLSATYLQDPALWMVIWDYQSPSFRSRWTPDNIAIGQVLWMPPQAVETARKLGLLAGKAPGASAPAKGLGTAGWVAAAAGAGLLLAGVVYLAGK